MTAACAYASHARSRLPSGVGHRLSAMLDTLSAGLRLLGSTIGVDAWRRHRIAPGTGGVDPALNCLLSLLDGLVVGLAMRPASGQFWDHHDKDAVARVPLQDHRIVGVLLAHGGPSCTVRSASNAS